MPEMLCSGITLAGLHAGCSHCATWCTPLTCATALRLISVTTLRCLMVASNLWRCRWQKRQRGVKECRRWWCMACMQVALCPSCCLGASAHLYTAERGGSGKTNRTVQSSLHTYASCSVTSQKPCSARTRWQTQRGCAAAGPWCRCQPQRGRIAAVIAAAGRWKASRPRR